MPDLDDDAWRIIARQLADSDLASAVALKRCNSRFKDLVTPVVAEAVTRLSARWQDAARRCRQIEDLLTDSTEVLTTLDLSGNNIGVETDYITASDVEGESKEVGAMVIYEGREMVVSQGVDSDGDLKLRDTSGVLAIAKALEANAVLKFLHLDSNHIGDEGAVAIANALRVNEMLKSLDVRCNEISGDAAQPLATAVLASPSLEIFGSVPLKELHANTLDKLDLSGKHLGVPEALVLAKLVEGSEVLTTLDLRANDLGDEAKGVIRDALSGRKGFELKM